MKPAALIALAILIRAGVIAYVDRPRPTEMDMINDMTARIQAQQRATPEWQACQKRLDGGDAEMAQMVGTLEKQGGSLDYARRFVIQACMAYRAEQERREKGW